MRPISAIVGLVSLANIVSANFINAIYFDQYHTQDLPGTKVTEGINHVYLAFTNPVALNTDPPGNFTPFASVASIKERFGQDTKVIISLGGWGALFNASLLTKDSRALFAKNVGLMLDETGADGVDIDYEYPGGNDAYYKLPGASHPTTTSTTGSDVEQPNRLQLPKDCFNAVPNPGKESEVQTFPLLLQAIRDVIGSNKLLTIAVPGLRRDMIAYDCVTVPKIAKIVDYFNLLTYDLMNRRDNVTKHQTSVSGSLATVERYLELGLPASKAILGFAFYAKWFTTNSTANCAEHPLGCPTVLLEDALGQDTGKSGSVTFEPANVIPFVPPANLTVSPDGSCGGKTGYKCVEGACCGQYGFCGTTEAYCGAGCNEGYGKCTGVNILGSFQKALKDGTTDKKAGGHYYFDAASNLFWSWETPHLIHEKFKKIVEPKGLAGVMAWSLGEDTYDNKLILAIQKGVKSIGCPK